MKWLLALFILCSYSVTSYATINDASTKNNMSITPEEFLSNYAHEMVLDFIQNLDTVSVKGKYVVLQNIKYIETYFGNSYSSNSYQCLKGVDEKLVASLTQLFEQQSIVSVFDLRAVLISHVEKNIIAPLCLLNKKDNPEDYKRMQQQNISNIKAIIKPETMRILSNLKSLLRETIFINETFEEWINNLHDTLAVDLNKVELIALYEITPKRIKHSNGNVSEISDKAKYLKIELGSTLLLGLGSGFESNTNQEIADILLDNIAIEDNYLIVMQKFLMNFIVLKKSKHLKVIEAYRNKGENVNIRKTIMSFISPYTKY